MCASFTLGLVFLLLALGIGLVVFSINTKLLFGGAASTAEKSALLACQRSLGASLSSIRADVAAVLYSRLLHALCIVLTPCCLQQTTTLTLFYIPLRWGSNESVLQIGLEVWWRADDVERWRSTRSIWRRSSSLDPKRVDNDGSVFFLHPVHQQQH